MSYPKTRSWHTLRGETLFDIPGRWESFTERLRYLGNNRWLFEMESTSFDGREQMPTTRERLSTKALIWKLIASDDEIRSSHDYETDEDADDSKEHTLTNGPLCSLLREIATVEGADYCIRLLDREAIEKPVESVRIASVHGVARFRNWNVWYPGVLVSTRGGQHGHIGRPDADGSTGFIKDGESIFQRQEAKVPKRFIPEIKRLLAEHARLGQS